MAMTDDEMIEALQLTSQQKKAFSQLEKAFAECKKQGIKFIGYGEDQHAVNGANFLSVRDTHGSSRKENEINIDDINAPYYSSPSPFIDVETVIKVKQPKKNRENA